MKPITDADIARIPGWFDQWDIDLFRVLLGATSELGGDLAELGVYMGRSAVLVGSHLQSGETFTVVDTFGAQVGDDANQDENDEYYAVLTRADFERNYRSVLDELPVIVEGPSSLITDHASAGTHRFVHIDASHLYQHVVTDIESARTLLKPDGVVVFDDYRSPHTPGVAAAVWQAVGGGLRPFAVTTQKLYATWGDADAWRGSVEEWLGKGGSAYGHELQEIGDSQVVRIWKVKSKANKYVQPALLPTASQLARRLRSLRSAG